MRDSANGNFLWVEVLLSFLEGCTSIKEFTSGLLQPPSQFQDLYKQLLRRVAANSTDQKRLVIREVIRIVVISAREMQVEELQAAIEAALDDQFFDFLDLLESECGTFLRIVDNPADVNRKQVQLVHETFRVFITTDASRGEEFHVSLPEAHANFAVILLQYLSQIDSELTDEKFGQWTSDVASNTERTYPLIKYAASQWSLHFRLAVGAQTIAESSCLAVTEFIQHGPLLRWIESLAIFKNLPVLSRTAEDLIAWVKNQTCSIQQTAIKLLRDWSIEIKHLYTEYGHIVADYPNSIHGILFDLFPQPSIFHSRYGNGLCSLFDGLPVPWNPTSVVNYDQNYDISTCSDEQKLLALASHSQIRVLDQTNGQSVQLLHPEDSSHADRWAVLAMTFGAKKNLLAAIHCPLPVADTVLYRPSISVWNIENRTLLITSPVDFQFQDTILLLDHFEFSQDTRSLHGGGWSFDIEKGILDSSRIQSLSPTFGHVEAVMFSPDGQSILKLEQGGQRTLTVAKTSSHVSFNRPAYYLSKSDHPSDIPSQYFKESFYGPRYSVAPFLWWQQWREITRSYQFSPDSRWFARFTDDNKVILHDLHNGSHKVIYSSVGRILANNITFDQKSRRLAWTFDYINLNNESRTRVELWSTETSSPIAGVPLGSRWRERVEFCWDPAHLLLYRADVSVWNIPLAMEGRLNKISQDKGTIGAYAPGVMRVGYTADGHIFVNYRCASCVDASGAAPFSLIYEGGWAGLWYIAEQWGWRLPRPVGQALSDCGPWCVTRHGPQCRPLLTTHVFRNDKRHQKVTYESPYAYSLHRHPAASHDNILAMGDTVVDISNPDRLSVGENILISRADNMDILSTAFHLSGQLMACLVTTPFQNLEDPNGFTLALQMYCTRKNEHLTSVTFSSSMPREAKYLGPFVLIDPSPVPNYFLVLLLETAFDDASSGSKPNQPTAESYGGLRVWVFDLPSLAQARSFKVPQYDYRSSCNVPATTMTYHFNSQLNKLICCEERRVPPNFCQLWIVDIERGIGTVQFLPVFRRLSFAQSMDTIVAMSVRGWIQSKTLEEMEGEMIKQPELEVFKGDIDLWVLEDWKRLAYIPRKFAPCFESVIAVHPSGRIAYVAEFASRLVEISFQW
jgi:hypothetical protein